VQSPKGARLFELGAGPVALSLCAAAGPEDQALIDRVEAETEAEGFAATWFSKNGIGWASRLLDHWPGRSPGEPHGAPAKETRQ